MLALVPLVLHSLGAPLGEPVADDFDHLRYALFLPHRWLDGGGSLSFWRPLAYQGYFGLFARVFVTTPMFAVVLQAAMLAAATLLLHRTARRFMPAPWAAAAASFPILVESARALITVPVHFVDVGLILFSALALHEAAASRMPSALASLLASLLCKETAVATALVLPLVAPARRGAGRGRWIAGVAALTIAWGLAYIAVRSQNGLTLPRGLESSLGGMGVTWWERCRWAVGGTLRALFSLPAQASKWEPPLELAMAALVLVATVRFGRSPRARVRFAAVAPVVIGGVLWSAAATAPLLTVYPIWSPQRVVFAGIGLGVALCATLGAAQPWLLAALVAVRLALFALSPGPPDRVSMVPPNNGAFIDFGKLVRLQRLMTETRTVLQKDVPRLPHGARVGLLHPPIAATYAYGGDKALQIWYRDTTIHMLRYDDFRRHPEWLLSAIVVFQQDEQPQIRLVDPVSMQHYLTGVKHVQDEAWQAAFDELALAESTQTDRRAHSYLGRIAGRRAFAWFGVANLNEAEREARRALDLWRDGSDARYTLAACMAFTNRRSQALAHLDTLLKLYPGDRSARAMRDTLRRREMRPSPGRGTVSGDRAPDNR